MNSSNNLKKGVISVCIAAIIIAILWGVAQQKNFFFQTLILILGMFTIVVIQGSLLSLEKLKGKLLWVEYDGVVGTIVGKPKYVGDFEMEYRVSFVGAYLPEKHIEKDKSIGELFTNMLTRTYTINIRDSISRFQADSDPLAPEGVIRYYGSISGRPSMSREEILESSIIERDKILIDVRTRLYKIHNELTKQSALDVGSTAGNIQHIANIIDQVSPKFNVIDLQNRKERRD